MSGIRMEIRCVFFNYGSTQNIERINRLSIAENLAPTGFRPGDITDEIFMKVGDGKISIFENPPPLLREIAILRAEVEGMKSFQNEMVQMRQTFNQEIQELKTSKLELEKTVNENKKEIQSLTETVENKVLPIMEENKLKIIETSELVKIINTERLSKKEIDLKNKENLGHTKTMKLFHINGLLKICKFSFKDYELIYRGSRDGFKSVDFHEKCDNVRETLVVIKSQEGNVFGGFNSARWNEIDGYFNTSGTWIFGFDKNNDIIKFPCTTAANAIYCSISFGPIFGAHDIYIVDNCDSNNSSYVNGNISYDLWGRNAYFLNDGHHTLRVSEIEVFQKKLKK